MCARVCACVCVVDPEPLGHCGSCVVHVAWLRFVWLAVFVVFSLDVWLFADLRSVQGLEWDFSRRARASLQAHRTVIEWKRSRMRVCVCTVCCCNSRSVDGCLNNFDLSTELWWCIELEFSGTQFADIWYDRLRCSFYHRLLLMTIDVHMEHFMVFWILFLFFMWSTEEFCGWISYQYYCIELFGRLVISDCLLLDDYTYCCIELNSVCVSVLFD